MTRYALLLCLIFVQAYAAAQSFAPKDTLEFENLVNPVFEWMDVNNDGRLDILLSGQDITVLDDSRSLSLVYEQLPDSTFVLRPTDLETLGQQQFRIADLNGDGRQDLLMSATDGTSFEHAIYENNGNYTWDKVVINTGITHWEELRLADLDNDGFPEIITASAEGLEVFRREGQVWESVTLPEEIVPIITDPVLVDFDRDGFMDLLLMGQAADGDSVAWWLFNKKDINFEIQTVESDSLRVADYVVSDFDGDGFPDVFFSTGANDTERVTRLIMNRAGREIEDSVNVDLLQLRDAQVFAADLTSDGIVETDIEGLTAQAADPVIERERVFRKPTEIIYERDTLKNTSGQGRRYGDYDFDGDLDYFEVTVEGTEGKLWLFDNKEETKNEGPDGLEDLLSFRFMNTLYVVWNMATDDFTDPKSVTYDVTLSTADGQADLMAGGFDPVSLKRTVVGPGNQGHNDFLILEDAPQVPLFTSIMPIDNAFHYDVSECLQGTSGGACAEDLEVQEILICGSDFVQLETETGQRARWFSFAGGYLGTGPGMALNVAGDDFVIAVYERAGSCINAEVFEIQFEQGLPGLPDIGICEGEEVSVTIPGSWQVIRWFTQQQGSVANSTNTFAYRPEVDDLVTVEVTSFRGCDYRVSFQVSVSDSTATVPQTAYQIGEGESVRLEAGGGNRYLWLPADGLSNNQIARPLASPDQTTEYTVFVFNEGGCVSEIQVLVEVIQTAFAPDAFSPNGDGRNERYRVYDLEGPVSFTFTIFDRTGNRVFESSRLSEVVASGWDGTNNGVPVPAGTYFWRVKGTYLDGQEVLINGDTKGALQLIR